MAGHKVKLVWPHDSAIDAPAKYKKACTYEAFIPDPLSNLALNIPVHVAGAVSEAESAIRTLNDQARPALTPLARLLLRTESIASSKIEGMQIGVRELARAEARLEAGRKAGPTAQEVLANIDAMELAVHEAALAEPFTVTKIIAIHQRLMAKASPRVAGQIRTEQNWIGGNDYNPCGADFVPPPPEHVARLLADLCDAINDDRLPPLVQAALVHAQFETIHPFHDGNGRAGRALIHAILRRRGVAPAYVPPISVLLASARDRYIAGLTAFRGHGTNEWIEQFAAATTGASRLALSYLNAVQDLGARWRARLADAPSAPRSDAAAWAVIDVLPSHPMITAPVAIAATSRSKPSIYEALRQLQDAGVLAPLGTSQRNQSWEAVGLLDLLARLEAGQLDA